MTRRNCLLIGALFLTACLFCRPAMAVTRYVSANNVNAVSPYTNWSTAAATIQDAVDVSTAGDTVLVTNGVYNTGGRAAGGSHTLTNRVCIDVPITVQSVNGPDVTSIVGTQAGDASVRGVWMTNSSTLVGFTVTNGASASAYDDNGYGGGIWSQSTNAYVLNCSIFGNHASEGSGGVNAGTLLNCAIKDNSVYLNGGGAGGSTMYNCLITGNSARWAGGGTIGCEMYNCTIADNSAEAASGVYFCTLYNCISVDNYLTNGVLNNVAYATVNHSCSYPLQTNGVGNITNVPLFVNIAGDYRLSSNSPCINSGTNQSWMTNATDLAGNDRIINGTVDMGAYEFTSAVPSPTATPTPMNLPTSTTIPTSTPTPTSTPVTGWVAPIDLTIIASNNMSYSTNVTYQKGGAV
ncbi:MAG: hypothetical protein EOL87_15395, partial [Spartobacteria bacterium]|nr:hypothetical protein [Spartobacteria bacterium]